MRRRLMTVLAACLAAGSLRAADEPWLAYSAAKVREAPAIDGRLTDACWRGLEQTRPLTCIGGAAAPIVTTAMACWDAKNLYVAFTCGEPLMEAVNRRKTDGSMNSFDESVEIFIDTDQDRFTYLQLRVDICGIRDTHRNHDPDTALDNRWNGAAAQGQDQWTVEAAIPWSLVADRRPDESTVWGLNLNRNRSISPQGGWTCWSDTHGGFHAPSRFGNLVFFPYPIFLRSYFADVFRSNDEAIQRLKPRGPAVTAQSETQLAAIKADNEHFLESLEAAPINGGQDAAAYYARGLDQQRKLDVLQDEILLHVIKNLASASRDKP